MTRFTYWTTIGLMRVLFLFGVIGHGRCFADAAS